MSWGSGCIFKSPILSLLPGNWGHPWGFRREGGCCGGWDHISATAKASGVCQQRSFQRQFSFMIGGTTTEWKREPKPFDMEALMSVQVSSLPFANNSQLRSGSRRNLFAIVYRPKLFGVSIGKGRSQVSAPAAVDTQDGKSLSWSLLILILWGSLHWVLNSWFPQGIIFYEDTHCQSIFS